MSECPERAHLLAETSTANSLETKLQEILEGFRQVFKITLRFAEDPQQILVRTTVGGMHATRPIPAQSRIFELPEPDFLQFAPGSPPGSVKGLYLEGRGKIVLNKGHWCVETLIHEALHATSILSRRTDAEARLALLAEGLTEFLAGHIIYKEYPHCYENCFFSPPMVTACSYTYRKETKMWGAFCHFIPLSVPARLYFWDGDDDWDRKFSEFVQAVRSGGYPKYRNIWELPGKQPMSEKFHRECKLNFPRYTILYEQQPLEYSKIDELIVTGSH